MNGGVYRASHLCPHCFFEHAGGKASRRASFAKANVMAEVPQDDLAENDLVSSNDLVNSKAAEAVNVEATAEVKTVEAKKTTVGAVQVSNVHPFSADAVSDEVPLQAPAATKGTKIEQTKEALAQKPLAENITAHQAKAVVEPGTLKQKQEPKKQVEPKPVKQDIPRVEKATVLQQTSSYKEPKLDIGKRARSKADQSLALSTKPVSDQEVVAILDDVTAECVLNVELTPDLFTKGKFTGAKSEKIKAALLQGKKNALSALRDKARDMDANMVAGISIKNSMKAIGEKNIANVTVKASGVALIVEVAGEALEA